VAVYDPHPLLAISSVATAPSPATSGTSLVVASGEGTRFGSAFSFNATVCPAGQTPTPANSEIVRVSARPGSADTLTIARAQEGSSARTIVAGDLIFVGVTPKVLTDLETNTEYAFSSWSAPAPWHLQVVAGGVAAFTNLIQGASVVALAAAASGFAAMYIDPADTPVGPRTLKARVRARALVGSSAGPGVTFTFGLYPVATWNALASNARTGVATLGTAVCSTTIASPTGQHHAESAEATLSTADWYLLVVSSSGTTAANSQTDYGIQLQLRRT
jgi:hypothetical protein